MGAVMTAAAAVAGCWAVVLWLASLRLRDASIVDPFWGAGFAAVAWAALAVAGPSPRGLLAAGLTSLWAGRLGLHLWRRRRGHGEDRRYAAMRAAAGPAFWLSSLATVFLLQGALLWVVSLPLQAGAARGHGAPLGTLDALGVALFLAGFVFEAVADAQLARFLAEPGSRLRVMDRGLWSLTRHPNYFGDFLLWWGLGALGLAAGAWWSLAGPALMAVLLMRVSGVTLLERTIVERRPGYAEYAARTPAFFPWPRRRATPPPPAA
jgi:steroid 5-alpha reductase family enzyme